MPRRVVKKPRKVGIDQKIFLNPAVAKSPKRIRRTLIKKTKPARIKPRKIKKKRKPRTRLRKKQPTPMNPLRKIQRSKRNKSAAVKIQY